MRKAHGRGRGHALPVVADFLKEFWLCNILPGVGLKYGKF